VVLHPTTFWAAAIEGLGTSYAGGWAIDPAAGPSGSPPQQTVWGTRQPVCRPPDRDRARPQRGRDGPLLRWGDDHRHLERGRDALGPEHHPLPGRGETPAPVPDSRSRLHAASGARADRANSVVTAASSRPIRRFGVASRRA
jgi:hypothetical protein